MTLYLSNRDGVGGTSLTNEEGHYRFQTQSWTGNTVMGSGDELAVTQNSPLGMSVLIGTGDFKIDTTGYSYTGWNSASLAATISTANPSNPRKDAVVLYVDKAQNTPGTANNPGIIKHMVVAGTPAGSPVAPDDTAISTAVGASNPFIRLANVTVGTGVTQITNANISSTRVLAAPKLPANSVTTTAITDGAVTAPKLGLIYAAGNNSSDVSFSTSGTYTTVASVSVAPTTTTIFQIDAICQHALANNQESQIRIYDSSTSTVLFEASNVSNPNDLLRTQGVHTQISLTSGTHNIALQIRAYNGSAGTHKVYVRCGSLTIFSIGV